MKIFNKILKLNKVEQKPGDEQVTQNKDKLYTV